MGVVTYILLSGKIPFPGDNNKEIIENVTKGDFHFEYDAFKQVSDEAKDLISKLLVKDYEARLSAEGALDHNWIKKAENNINHEVAEDVY